MDIGKKNKNRLKGSITVEASLVVPIFFLAIFVFMYLFESLAMQNDLQDQLDSLAENYAFYGVQPPCIRTRDGVVRQVGWNTEDGEGYCDSEIQYSIPGLPAWLLQVRLYQRVQIHDYAGRSMVPEDAMGNSTYVYVAENGTVYHRDIACTYLKLGIQSVGGNVVDTMRNQSGAKYKPCESCMGEQSATDYSSVYITPYGARYHQTRDCSGLRRTVRRVLQSDVPGLPPCSKCGT